MQYLLVPFQPYINLFYADICIYIIKKDKLSALRLQNLQRDAFICLHIRNVSLYIRQYNKFELDTLIDFPSVSTGSPYPRQ